MYSSAREYVPIVQGSEFNQQHQKQKSQSKQLLQTFTHELKNLVIQLTSQIYTKYMVNK